MRLFLYEYATAQPDSVILPRSVRREGRAMFDVLWEDALALPGMEVVVLSPPGPEEECFRELARRSDLALIIAPEFEGLLEARCQWVEEEGCQLLGSSAAGVRRTADKWEVYQLWRRRGVPTPETWLAVEGLPVTGGGPFVQKHRFGAGSLEVCVVETMQPLNPDHLLQRWVPGIVASISVVVDAGGRIHPLLPGRQRIADDGGFTYLGGLLPLEEPHASRLRRLAIQAVEAVMEQDAPLLGYVGVDAILGDGADGSQDYVLEINPRVTTSYVGLRRAASVNLLDLVRRAVQGEQLPDTTWHHLPIEFTADGRVSFS